VTQIKSKEVIDTPIAPSNAAVALPRDMDPKYMEKKGDPFPVAPEPATGERATEGLAPFDVNNRPVPAAPVIQGLGDQAVRFTPDGRAVIDAVLQVQKDKFAVKYEVRIAKNAGYL
jgi:hypothetical protein